MNNCIVQGEITSIGKVKFSYYDKLKAILVIYIAISCDVCNIMECRLYDKDIDTFLDKYKLEDICILSGSLRNKNESKNSNSSYVFVKQIY